ncbi:hypothetical protein HGRIS_003185 [Hohenbuehelia grisea]|uniref:Uncharacterized protein n=1 Tax=Hohenbuehelia grisea TaxID=104357 RepID=A0ABR3JNQ3_9AGAR
MSSSASASALQSAMAAMASELSTAFDKVTRAMTALQKIKSLEDSHRLSKSVERHEDFHNFLAAASAIFWKLSTTLSKSESLFTEGDYFTNGSPSTKKTDGADIVAETDHLKGRICEFQTICSSFASSVNHPAGPTQNEPPSDALARTSPVPPAPDVGPVQIIPGIWLGTHTSARDWSNLARLHVHSILNVAREAAFPHDVSCVAPKAAQIKDPVQALADHAGRHGAEGITRAFYPADDTVGRPGMSYLKLPWAEKQGDLARDHTEGFPAAMPFIEDALRRDEGVLIHSGDENMSRAVAMIVAFVMWTSTAARCLPSTPPRLRPLNGMLDAYSLVKSQSRHVRLDASHAIQLLEYEERLKDDDFRNRHVVGSPSGGSSTSTTLCSEDERSSPPSSPAASPRTSPKPSGRHIKELDAPPLGISKSADAATATPPKVHQRRRASSLPRPSGRLDGSTLLEPEISGVAIGSSRKFCDKGYFPDVDTVTNASQVSAETRIRKHEERKAKNGSGIAGAGNGRKSRALMKEGKVH